MVDKEEQDVRFRDSDEYVKPKLIEKLFEGHELFRSGNFKACFDTYSGIYTLLYSRDFPLKAKLFEYTEFLSDFFDSLDASPKSVNEQLQIGKRKQSVRKYLYEYMLDITNSMDYLGLLLKTKVLNNDIHKDLSEQNFGDELTMINDCKAELSKSLNANELLNLMNNNQIYQVYALWRYDNAVQE